MFIKSMKKAMALITVLLVFSGTAKAEFYSVPEGIQVYGQQIYSVAKSYFGRRSFSGYCGTYVKCQLRAMGIFEGKFDFNGNGNKWYSNFENVISTSGGYYVYRESGSDCIDKLTAKYGEELKNVVVSFPIQSGYSERYPGAGHAFVIYEIRNGIAYYSESFGFGSFGEGEVVAEDVASLMERYERRHGQALGCVMLSETPLDDEALKAEILALVKENLAEITDINFVARHFTEMSESRTLA